MRVAVVVAAMFFCSPVFAQGVKLPSVTNSIGMVLIEIPAGKFTMGSPVGEKDRQDREAQVAVTLTKPFGLGKYEVTQGQWKEVMGTEPWSGEDVELAKDCPATFVSWNDATKFCQKLTEIERKSGTLKANEEYRLPTEAEWEYACRAGTETAFSFGDDKSKLGEYAWYDGNTKNIDREWAHKVGSHKPNPWGLHDMHGNVWEWCSDWFGNELSGGTDPIGPRGGSNRALRGGSWMFPPEDSRSARKIGLNPSHRFNSVGFRAARSQSVTETRQGMSKTEPVKKVFKSVESVTNSIGMVLIEIPAGKFTMGSDHQEGEAQVRVTLTKSCGLGKTEVTQGQWKSVMGTEPWGGQNFVQADKDCPATWVSWDDATEFCEKLTDLERKSGKLKAGEEYRLPTEAEWEYACRAGTTTVFSFGDDESKLGEYGWFNGNASNAGEQYAHEVGLKNPNPWGLYDMHGNVAEWCSDWYGIKLSGGTDPVGPKGGSDRVIRGGGWRGISGSCRSANRKIIDPSIRHDGLGFRVARIQSAQ